MQNKTLIPGQLVCNSHGVPSQCALVCTLKKERVPSSARRTRNSVQAVKPMAGHLDIPCRACFSGKNWPSYQGQRSEGCALRDRWPLALMTLA